MCRTWSGGVSVLVDEAVASGGLDDLEPGWIGFGGRWWQRWSLLEGADRPVGVVMVDVVDVVDVVDDEVLELTAVPDDGAVDEFTTQ